MSLDRQISETAQRVDDTLDLLLPREGQLAEAMRYAALAPGKRVRFFHIDGEHTQDHLSKDLALGFATLDAKGVLCLDDMLHPGYPTLALTVDAFLRANPELRVFCVIDREDIVAAAKFMMCREEQVAFYTDALTQAFPQFVWPLGADFVTYKALVLAPEPRLAEI